MKEYNRKYYSTRKGLVVVIMPKSILLYTGFTFESPVSRLYYTKININPGSLNVFFYDKNDELAGIIEHPKKVWDMR